MKMYPWDCVMQFDAITRLLARTKREVVIRPSLILSLENLNTFPLLKYINNFASPVPRVEIASVNRQMGGREGRGKEKEEEPPSHHHRRYHTGGRYHPRETSAKTRSRNVR